MEEIEVRLKKSIKKMGYGIKHEVNHKNIAKTGPNLDLYEVEKIKGPAISDYPL